MSEPPVCAGWAPKGQIPGTESIQAHDGRRKRDHEGWLRTRFGPAFWPTRLAPGRIAQRPGQLVEGPGPVRPAGVGLVRQDGPAGAAQGCPLGDVAGPPRAPDADRHTP